MRIFFLDIDGVCASYGLEFAFNALDFDLTRIFGDTNHEPFNLENFFWLNRLALEHGDLEFVISSSWRNIHTQDEIKQAFQTAHERFLRAYDVTKEEFPLAIKFHEHWKTERSKDFYHRGHEIQDWLNIYGARDENGHLRQRYVIVDDDGDMLLVQKENFIQTKMFQGFGPLEFDKASQILSKDPQPVCCTPRTKLDELLTYTR